MKWSSNNGGDWTITLDQDSECSDCIIDLYKPYLNKEDVGMLTCRYTDRNLNEENVVYNSDCEEIDFCITSASLLKNECWKKTAGFDEYLFIDKVDNDICLKLQENGFKIICVNKVGFTHEVGKAKKISFLGKKCIIYNHNAFRRYYIARNTVYIAKKYKNIMLFFYTASVSMTLCLESVEDQLKFLKHSYYSIGIVVFIAFVLYNDKFRFILNLSNLFSRDSRYRWEYGFYHANFVGNITICLLLLSFIISQIKKKINSRVAFSKVFCVGINTISICMLLASASRSNMLAIIVLGLAFLFANINEWLPIKRKYTGTIQGLIIILIIMLVLFSGSDNMYDSLFKLSNRNLNFTINIPSLIASGKVLFGIGYVDAGLFGSNKLPMATWYVDNSYLYVFLTMGIAGIAWFIVLLARLFLKIRKYDKAFGLNFTFTCVFVTYMFLGMSETCIFYPTFVSSFVYFVAFISCCFIKDNCDEST